MAANWNDNDITFAPPCNPTTACYSYVVDSFSIRKKRPLTTNKFKRTIRYLISSNAVPSKRAIIDSASYPHISPNIINEGIHIYIWWRIQKNTHSYKREIPLYHMNFPPSKSSAIIILPFLFRRSLSHKFYPCAPFTPLWPLEKYV